MRKKFYVGRVCEKKIYVWTESRRRDVALNIIIDLHVYFIFDLNEYILISPSSFLPFRRLQKFAS